MRWSLTLQPRLECSGTIFTATSTSPVEMILLQPRKSWDYKHVLPCPANFVFFVDIGFHHVGQADLELLASSDPPISASQSAGVAGISHYARLRLGILQYIQKSKEIPFPEILKISVTFHWP